MKTYFKSLGGVWESFLLNTLFYQDLMSKNSWSSTVVSSEPVGALPSASRRPELQHRLSQNNHGKLNSISTSQTPIYQPGL